MDTPSEMGTPSARAMRADHGLEGDDVDAHSRPVTRISRPTSEGWGLTFFGAILVGLIGLLGWTGYALSIVKADLRQVHADLRQLHASVAPLEPRSAESELLPAETEQRFQTLDQRLRAGDKPPVSPPALPRTTQLPRNTTGAPRTPQDHQASRDMRQQAAATGRFGAPVPESFGTWLAWHPAWELRWLSVQVSGRPPVYLYHITYKPDPGQRYTIYRDPDRRTWHQWTLWQRGS
jgi:hypothetical protein